MMGRLKSDQGQLFYEFHLGDAVPEDHLVRKIDAALDLSWLRGELAPHYSSIGRPSIDPELMIRMLVVGYVFAIRSERLICREVQVNLAYRWFCKLGIEDAIPDHSAFTRVTACTLALSPIRDTHSEGFSYFVTSIAAPAASGWSDCRVGLAPTGKRRLVTAHTRSRHQDLTAIYLKTRRPREQRLTVGGLVYLKAVERDHKLKSTQDASVR